MSTRSTTWFIGADGKTPTAKIYRHTDGYPEGHGVDLQRFFREVEAQTQDTRFGDPSYLAAKLVVYLAAQFAPYQMPWDFSSPLSTEVLDAQRTEYAKEHPLDFLSVGIVADDPGDIEFIYVVNCGKQDANGYPDVTCYAVEGGWDEPVKRGEVVSVPEFTEVPA